MPQDLGKAEIWLWFAANQGLPQAQYNLGLMFANGDGVSQDYVAAHSWLSLAASGLPPLSEMRAQAVGSRNHAATLMTPDELARSARRIRAWTEKNSE